MAAPIGNENAKGNAGGRPYSKENREKAATLKGLALDWMLGVMQGEDEVLKKEIVMKIASTCLPQEHQVGGDAENPLIIQISKEIAEKNVINSEPSDNSEGPAPIQSS